MSILWQYNYTIYTYIIYNKKLLCSEVNHTSTHNFYDIIITLFKNRTVKVVDYVQYMIIIQYLKHFLLICWTIQYVLNILIYNANVLEKLLFWTNIYKNRRISRLTLELHYVVLFSIQRVNHTYLGHMMLKIGARPLYCILVHVFCIVYWCTSSVLYIDARLLYCILVHVLFIVYCSTSSVLYIGARPLYCILVHVLWNASLFCTKMV